MHYPITSVIQLLLLSTVVTASPSRPQTLATAAAQYSSRYPQPPAHNNFYPNSRHNSYGGHYPYTQNIWEHGLAECSCAGCVDPMKQQVPYFVPHGYSQPVMG
ncbi:hypothetical protein NM208_g9427 [Fusarium decemcellulare]|uniref:Uncharacterized protein n=1 Tax=Fusarium decemcellulare TaxID=57161 RepID=A0ACC1S1M8_9HYPO|nr:hypothetical protein NM208_g9427 [Fusarium decemcellulare]